MPGETDPRDVRREAAVAPFRLYNPVADIDLTEGEYPDLLEQLGTFSTTLQPFIDEAWAQTLEMLWAIGRWPDLELSTSAFRRPVRERSFFLIFKFLLRNTPGSPRWERLMEYHQAEMSAAWASFNSRIDYDLDGLPDRRGRDGALGIVHRNAHYRRRMRRTPRW